MRKQVLYLLFSVAVLFTTCTKPDAIITKTVIVQLEYPAASSVSAEPGVLVTVSSGNYTDEAETDANGRVTFTVPVDIYEISATDTRSVGGIAYIYNGVRSSIGVSTNWNESDVINLTLEESKSSQIVIKEVFVGGTPRDDGSGAFQFDKYVILYNNSAIPANLGNLCIGMIAPFNAQATNNYYGTDGKLAYESEGWIPAVQGYWYFQQNFVLQPGKQAVIALYQAVDHTSTYSRSINFNNSEYFAMYDLTKYANANYYASPSASIPTSQHLKAEFFATGNAWSLSNTSPGLFIFDPQGTTPAAFASDASQTHVLNAAYTSKKVPVEWVVDGVEGYLLNNNNNSKRFTASVDAGYVYHLNNQGYSIYRNVDKEATEAIADNAGKLVTTYSYGTVSIGGTTDPSGIDAEASIANGARIIYKDTNNSTNDFHLRSKASLSNQ